MLALLAGLVVVVVIAIPGTTSRSLLAPQATCGNNDIRCFVRHVRARAHLPALRSAQLLTKAAKLKAGAIDRCDEFSHTPCGQPPTQAVVTAGYAPKAWAENLYLGNGWLSSAREAVRRWLESPPHRANLLSRRFDEYGVASLHDVALDNESGITLWVLELGRN